MELLSFQSAFAVLAVAFLSLVSLLGTAYGFLPQDKLKQVLPYVVAFGVGTMVGDATVHLIPTALGVHGHEEDHSLDHSLVAADDDDEHEHEHNPVSPPAGEEEEHMTTILVSTTIAAGFFLFFLVEIYLRHVFGHHPGHHHNHKPSKAGLADEESHPIQEITDVSADVAPDAEMDPKIDVGAGTHHEIAPFGYINLVGDAIHNFLDGVAIAVSFAENTTLGVSTTVAVALHELPQEMSDFGILLQSGMTMKQAVVGNLAASVSSFVGVAVGLVLATAFELAEPYLLALTAGGFLYLALADMLPEADKASSAVGSASCVFGGLCVMVAFAFLE